MRCPICQTDVKLDDPEFPFCSQRCRTADLANWASEVYRIPAAPERPAAGPEEDQ